MTVLLDTNAYTALRRGHEGVAARVRGAFEVVVPVVVAGELLFGFRNGTRYEANSSDLRAFLAAPRVRFAGAEQATAERYGRIAAVLRKKGTPIPSNDVWIAAHCMELGAELLTFDAHFAHVDGLAWTHMG